MVDIHRNMATGIGVVVVVLDAVGILKNQILGLGDFDFLRFAIEKVVGVFHTLDSLSAEPKEPCACPKSKKRQTDKISSAFAENLCPSGGSLDSQVYLVHRVLGEVVRWCGRNLQYAFC